MNFCFVSHRTFSDGRVRDPILENDPANLAYAMDGAYLSLYTLRALTPAQLRAKLQPFDLVIVTLDLPQIDQVERVVNACRGRVATYSEGHISDYQTLSPGQQIAFLRVLDAATINFLYWEKYIPFYRTLTRAPVVYLPYPYLLEHAQQCKPSSASKPVRGASPTGLAGSTRNGLASLSVLRHLERIGLIDQVVCWLEPGTWIEDQCAIEYFFFATPFKTPPRQFDWRARLIKWQIDYRFWLRLRNQLRVARPPAPEKNISDARLVCHRRSNWQAFLRQLAGARVMVDLNNRETVGRNALDCAALGIPCVSTDRSDMQRRLFPETTLTDSWDVEGAIQLTTRLLQDENFCQRVVAFAAQKIQAFDVPSFRRRFESVLVPDYNL